MRNLKIEDNNPVSGRSRLYAWLAVAALALVALLFFFPDAVEGNVLQQSDMQQGLANGQEGKAYLEQTGEQTRWTNSLFSGMPNFQIAPSYASESMLGWIAKIYTLWLPSPANLLFAMMLGFFIMCLCFKMKWWNALFGAVAWGFSTYFIILIGAGHIWKFVTLAYIPPTIGGIVLCYRKKYLAGATLTALFGALQLMSNHPQMTYYFLYVVAAMVIAWLVDAIREKRIKEWAVATAVVLGGGVLAVGANLSGLYSTYEYSKETIRGKASDLTAKADGKPVDNGPDKAYITGWSYGVDETLTLLIPNVKGGATIKPVAGQNELKSLAEVDTGYGASAEEYQLLGQFPQYFGNQPMTNGPVYVGAFVLLLAILALLVVPGMLKWMLFAVTILAIVLSWGHNFMPVTDFFIDNVPLYAKFRTVSSILVIVEFTVPLLAVMCLREIARDPDFFKKYSMQFYVVFGVGAFLCLLGAVAPSIYGTPFSVSELEQLQGAGVMSNPQYSGLLRSITSARLSLVSADSWRSLIFIAMAFVLLMLYFKRSFKSMPALALGLTAIMLIDLFSVNKRYVNSENFTEPAPQEEVFAMTNADRQILQDTAMNYRVLDIPGFGAARSSYFHKTIGGYHAAKLTRYNDLIDNQIMKNNEGVLNMLNTKYVILQGDTVVENPDALGNAWFVDRLSYVDGSDAEMKALDNLNTASAAVADRKFSKVLGNAMPKAPGDTIFETSYAPNRLTYAARSAKGGLAVFSEIYFPWGWEATIDGKPVEIGRVNYVLRALSIPAGNHTVDFVFRPRGMEKAQTWSVISIICIYLLILASAALCVMFFLRLRKSKAE